MSRRANGFTLVEALVGLALLGVLSLFLLSSVRLAGAVVQRERADVVARDEIVAAQRLIRSRIERQRAVLASASTPMVDARGTRGDYVFVAPSLDRDAPAPLQRFRLMRTAAGELMLYSANTRDLRVDDGGNDLTGWQPALLLGGVAELSLSYFGTTNPADGPRWQEQWVRQPQPPALIRISVAFPSGDRRRWPDLLVAPRATVNSACRIDALTGRCGGES